MNENDPVKATTSAASTSVLYAFVKPARTSPAWSRTTPFGLPVEPEVKLTKANDPGAGAASIGELELSVTSSRSNVRQPVALRARSACAAVATARSAPPSSWIRRIRSMGSAASIGTKTAPAAITPYTVTKASIP